MTMKKRRDAFVQSPPPYPCFFGCGRSLVSKYDRNAWENWIWFCGYGPGPVHFCPECRKTRRDEIEAIRARLGRKPAGYPDEFASPYPPDGVKSLMTPPRAGRP